MSRLAGLVVALALVAQPVAAFDSEIQALTEQLASRLNQDSSTTTVAVVEFRNLEGDATSLGRFLSEQFSVRLLNSAGFELFNRSKLARLLDEIKLSEDGFVSPESAKRLELEGVEVLITGTVTELGEVAQLSVEALRTSTARVVAAATGRIPLGGDLEHLVGRTIHQVAGASSKPGRTSQLILPGGKQIGPFRIALTDLKLVGRESNRGRSSGSVSVSATFEIVNTSGQEWLAGVAATRHGSSATDNRSNLFELAGGLEPILSFRHHADRAITLSSTGKSEVTLLFVADGVLLEDVGDRFSVTWAIAAFDRDSQRSANFSVSFRDVVLRR